MSDKKFDSDWKQGCLTLGAEIAELRTKVEQTNAIAARATTRAVKLELQLAESQARVKKLREALFSLIVEGKSNSFEAQEALALTSPQDALAPYLRCVEALEEVSARIKDHPAYAELTEHEEENIGGDTAEFSYLVRVCNTALAAVKGVDK